MYMHVRTFQNYVFYKGEEEPVDHTQGFPGYGICDMQSTRDMHNDLYIFGYIYLINHIHLHPFLTIIILYFTYYYNYLIIIFELFIYLVGEGRESGLANMIRSNVTGSRSPLSV